MALAIGICGWAIIEVICGFVTPTMVGSRSTGRMVRLSILGAAIAALLGIIAYFFNSLVLNRYAGPIFFAILSPVLVIPVCFLLYTYEKRRSSRS